MTKMLIISIHTFMSATNYEQRFTQSLIYQGGYGRGQLLTEDLYHRYVNFIDYLINNIISFSDYFTFTSPNSGLFLVKFSQVSYLNLSIDVPGLKALTLL